MNVHIEAIRKQHDRGACACDDGYTDHPCALAAENERLRAVVKAARVLAQNYAVARDLDYHVRQVRDAVNELDAR